MAFGLMPIFTLAVVYHRALPYHSSRLLFPLHRARHDSPASITALDDWVAGYIFAYRLIISPPEAAASEKEEAGHHSACLPASSSAHLSPTRKFPDKD